MMTLTLILSLFACADYTLTPTTGGSGCGAGPDEVVDLDSGRRYERLDDVDWTSGKSHRICLGAGKHLVEGPLLALDSDPTDPPELLLYGAGAMETRLVPMGEDSLRIITHGDLTLMGVGFAGPADLIGDHVELLDVAVHSVEAPDELQLFTVYGYSVDAEGLTFSNNLIRQGLFTIGGRGDDASISIRDLRVYDNRATYALDMVLRDADISLDGVEIFENSDVEVDDYRHFFTTWGLVDAVDVAITRNRVNGPAWTVGGPLHADGLMVTDHVSEWASTLYVAADTRLLGAVLRRNDSPSGAVGLYRTSVDVGAVWMSDTDMGGGPWDNLRCDVSIRGYCLADDLDMVDELLCDDHGCR
ncbi:MAG: hypothetical protein H6740_26165 [Alphaproteobacteria bacterium]|nr:hypothetical protein [Alphaproteobacteria bacterium]